ncbi:MAG: FAD-dependent oxidoreductase [Piscinibacter sp.]|uniref:NAD(P)/FAD-dependent oxidoreductase n=1 Tax=Piscinibacter sp. TaxID=1903157 RepID=UPI001B6C28A1|nr:FAD-dependent oxidoreductase [Piscinibacter sp.]MBP5990473.1 FAD-dependent oxidoreductase [Piscinibacter sp.]MBP6027734.1 FAD-dependent oxidoreductase [Piscinibacter sp.]
MNVTRISPAGSDAAAPPRVAVVGGGITGLAAAHALSRAGLAPVLFEAQARLGGHAHTIEVELPDAAGRRVRHGVDVGFLVFNERTYPGFIALLHELGVQSARSDMSFSVQAPDGLNGRGPRLEWSGTDADTLFAQRRNLLSPPFWRMLADIRRFNRLATALARADAPERTGPGASLAEFLAAHRFSREFQEGYLLPMVACIWSCPPAQMLHYPARSLAQFCHNHGLLQISARPAWFTVRGGSRHYVQALAARLPDVRSGCAVQAARPLAGGGWRLETSAGAAEFDALVLACHAPQAAALLGAATPARALLAQLRTQPNRAVLHTDAALLPRLRKAWAAWNFERAPRDADGAGAVCLHYWINRLQPLPFAAELIVSLNPVRESARGSVLWEGEVHHPVFDAASFDLRARLQALQGHDGLWLAGAWCGHGFHEDGLRAGEAAAAGLLRAWRVGALARATGARAVREVHA